MNTKTRLAALGIAAIAAIAIAPAVASAEGGPVPSYAHPAGETIKGTITSFDGAYTMYVHDVRGYIDTVRLHQGTVINPTGIHLQSGYPVTITGHPRGDAFEADEIDTPFQAHHYYAYPVYPYPYVYPYVYGYGRWGWRP